MELQNVWFHKQIYSQGISWFCCKQNTLISMYKHTYTHTHTHTHTHTVRNIVRDEFDSKRCNKNASRPSTSLQSWTQKAKQKKEENLNGLSYLIMKKHKSASFCSSMPSIRCRRLQKIPLVNTKEKATFLQCVMLEHQNSEDSNSERHAFLFTFMFHHHFQQLNRSWD